MSINESKLNKRSPIQRQKSLIHHVKCREAAQKVHILFTLYDAYLILLRDYVEIKSLCALFCCIKICGEHRESHVMP